MQQVTNGIWILTLALTMGLQACTPSPANKVARAEKIMMARVAKTVTVRLDPGSQVLYEPPGNFYYVCASGIVNNPGLTNNEHQRIIMHVNKEMNDGIAFFDGSTSVEGKAKFQADWEKKCR